jgi:RimJ/RimL family protein N-acetyltransferase
VTELNWPLVQTELTDGAVLLRAWTPLDVQWLFETCQDLEIQRWTRVPIPYLLEDATSFALEHAPGKWRERTGISCAVVDAASNTTVGSIGVTLRDPESRVAEAGYYCAPGWRGQGLTHRALALITSWIFEVSGWERIELHIDPENEQSRKVAVRAGYELEGILKRKIHRRGEQRDVAMYAMICSPRH